jgi:hypothetical protein
MPKNKELSFAASSSTAVLESRLYWLDYQGIRMLCLDFSAATVAESLGLIDEFETIVKGEPDGSILMLTDVTDAAYDSAISNKWKSKRLQYDVKMRASVVFGLSGLVGIAVKAFVDLTKLLGMAPKRSPVILKTREQALVWLSKQ